MRAGFTPTTCRASFTSHHRTFVKHFSCTVSRVAKRYTRCICRGPLGQQLRVRSISPRHTSHSSFIESTIANTVTYESALFVTVGNIVFSEEDFVSRRKLELRGTRPRDKRIILRNEGKAERTKSGTEILYTVDVKPNACVSCN